MLMCQWLLFGCSLSSSFGVDGCGFSGGCLHHIIPVRSVLVGSMVGVDEGAVEGGGVDGGEQSREEKEKGCGTHHGVSPSVTTPTAAQLLYYFANIAHFNLFKV